MRRNRSQTAKRRSHHALVAKNAAKCVCGAPRMSHRACSACGKYNGRVVIDVVARAKRETRRSKRRAGDIQASGRAADPKAAAKT